MQADPNHEEGGMHTEDDPLYHSITGRNAFEEKSPSCFIDFLSLLLLHSIKGWMIQTFLTIFILAVLYLLQSIVEILGLLLIIAYLIVISPLLIFDELKISVFGSHVGGPLFAIPIPNFTGIILLLSLFFIIHLIINLIALSSNRSPEK